MKIEENISLREFTTFKIGGSARYFTRLTASEEVPELINFAKEKNLPIFILGGGSNIIVSDDGINFLVIKNEIKGKEIINETEKEVLISVGAGENWDEFVEFTVSRNFAGVEALSAIPGTVGGAPIQNIGAYGSEVSDVIDSVHVYDTEKKSFDELTKGECEFSYRDSVFKKNPSKFFGSQSDFFF